MLNKKNKGFTLIELLAVIALLAIVGITSYSIIRRTMMNAKLKAIQTTATTLEKQAKDKVTLKEEYLCYTKDVDSTFSSSSIAVCNTSNTSCHKDTEYEGCKRYFGNKKCNSLYNLTDDYRMGVYYQPATSHIYMYFGIMWDGKLKEYSEVKSKQKYKDFIEKYNAREIAELSTRALSSTEDNIYNEYITWDNDKRLLAGKKLKEYTYKDNSDQKKIRRGSTRTVEEISDSLGTPVNKKIKVSDACSALYSNVDWSQN